MGSRELQIYVICELTNFEWARDNIRVFFVQKVVVISEDNWKVWENNQ